MARDRNDSRSESLAGAASEQVRAIVAAAEATAAQIREEAEEEAKRIRGEAIGEAKAASSRAAAQAGERVTRVSESAVAMLGRIEAIDRELSALLDSLRTGATRLSADLTVLQAEFADARQAAPAEPEPEADEDEDEGVELAQDAAVELDDGPAPEPEPEPKPVGSAKPAAAANGDLEGARLIALNMALSGTSRDEVDSYLTENFDLANQVALLDEVYTSLGG